MVRAELDDTLPVLVLVDAYDTELWTRGRGLRVLPLPVLLPMEPCPSGGEDEPGNGTGLLRALSYTSKKEDDGV